MIVCCNCLRKAKPIKAVIEDRKSGKFICFHCTWCGGKAFKKIDDCKTEVSK